MDLEVISTVILLVTATVMYVDVIRFFREGKYPYFIGRPLRALKMFFIFELFASAIIIAVEAIPLIWGMDERVFGIFAGVAEEPGKILPVIYFARKNKFFREYLKDGGWFYIGLIAGFAFGVFEFILYSFGIIGNYGFTLEALRQIVLDRLSVMGLHALFTVVSTWGYANYLSGRMWRFLVGLGGMMIVHSLYDFLVFWSYTGGGDLMLLAAVMIYPVMLGIYFVMKHRVKDFYKGDNYDWLFRVFIVSS